MLPASQQAFWAEYAQAVPRTWVLYGGTAIALHLGHRQSIDFDFFSSEDLDDRQLRQALPLLDSGTVFQKTVDTLVLSCPLAGSEVKLSFFARIKFGRVGEPALCGDKLLIASRFDLLATKLKVIHDRIEVKDYLDIEALLRSGLTLTEGIFAAQALYGNQLSALDTAKAICWFKDGDLERKLAATTRDYLTLAAANFDGLQSPPPLSSTRLA